MRSRIIGLLAALLLVGGFFVLNYPSLGTLYNQIRQEKVMDTYENKIQTMDEETRKKYKEAAEEYNKRLAEGSQTLTDAFSDDSEQNRADSAYDSVLDMEESGVMGSLEIPAISLYLPFYHGTSSEVLEKGVGHLEGSSFPVGGENTHAVLTGHRGLPSAELFTNLDQIEKGDEFYIHILGETLAYQVYDIETVEPSQTESLAIEKGQDLVTLVTCTPYGINTHRLLIHGRRTAYTDDSDNQEEARKDSLLQWLLKQKILLVSAGILVLALLYGVFRLCRAKKTGGANRRKKRR